MLEFIRRHQYGLMLIVAIVVIIGFSLFYNHLDPASASANDAMNVDGKMVRVSDMRKIADTRALAPQLGREYQMFDQVLFGQRYGDNDHGPYVARLLILRKEAKKLGIHPTTKQIQEELKNNPGLQTNGAYDPSKWSRLITEVLPRLGFTPQTLEQYVSDKISFEKVRELIGANYLASDVDVEEFTEGRAAEFSLTSVAINRADYEKDIVVTDEELSDYFADNKERYSEGNLRSVEFVMLPKPVDASVDFDWEDPIKEESESGVDSRLEAEEMPAAPDPEADPAAEADRIAKEKEAAAKQRKDQALAKENRRRRLEWQGHAQSTYQGVGEKLATDSSNFAAEVAAFQVPGDNPPKLNVVSTAAFSKAKPPVELLGETAVVDQIFNTGLQGGGFGEPVEGTKGYYIFRVVEELDAVEPELDKIKDKVTADLKGEKTNEAVQTAATEAREKLKAALGEGKSFVAAAEELSLTPTSQFGVSNAKPVPGPDGRALLQAAATTAVGNVSEPASSVSGMVLVYPFERKTSEEEVDSAMRDQMKGFIAERGEFTMFNQWFEDRKDDANVRIFYGGAQAEGDQDS